MHKLFELIGVEFHFVAIRASLLEVAMSEPHRLVITEDDHIARKVTFTFAGRDHCLTDQSAARIEDLFQRGGIGREFLFAGYHSALVQASVEQSSRLFVLDDNYHDRKECFVTFAVTGQKYTLMGPENGGILCE